MSARTRLPGWEDALADAFHAALERPYVLGRHDCALFAARCVKAVSGRDVLAGVTRWRGKKSALAVMRAMAAEGGARVALVNHTQPELLRLAVTAVLAEPVPVRLAMRGDVVLFVDEAAGEGHLGVCDGPQALVLGDTGLRSIPLGACSCAWEV